jgi:hypothetical protein
MAFDVQGARRAGYSTDEIVGFLAAEQKFDADAARKAGYSDDELLSHLTQPDATPAAEAPSAGRQAARGLGLGLRDVVEGAAALPGLAYDAAAFPLNKLLQGINAVTGAQLPTIRTAAENVSAVGDAVGLPRAETDRERLISGAVQGAASTLPTMGAGVALQGVRGAGGIANALSGGAASQVVGGAGAGAATELARQNELGPMAQMGAGLVGGVAGAGAVAAAGAAGRGARALMQPFTEGGRQEIVGNVLLRSSGRPETLEARLAAGADPVVPGSVPTTAEAARDPGLASLQRTVQSMDPASADAFAMREAARDAARRRAVQGIEPTEGGATVVADAVRNRVAREEQRFTNAATAADRRVAERLAALPERMEPSQAGSTIRGELGEARDTARAATSRAYEAIDPDGTSRLPLGPVQEAARNAEGRYFGDMAGPMPRELRAALDDVYTASSEVAPFQTLQNLRARLATLSGHPDQRVQAVAGQMRQAIDDTAERAALPYERPSLPRSLEDIERQFAGEGADQNPDIARRLEMSREELSARAGGEPAPAGQSALQFIIRNGGLRDEGGEISNMLGGTTRTRPGLLNNRGGLSLDEAAERLREAGFVRGTGYNERGPTGATQREILDLLDAELRGEAKVYRGGNTQDLRASRGASLADDLDREIAARGGVYDPNDPRATLQSLRGVDENAPAAGLDAPERFAPIPDAFTPEQAERWRAATAARREQGERFDRGPVRDVLATRMGGPLVPDSGIPARLFRPGGGGPEAVRQVLTAAADRPAAVQALEAHAATSLRDFAARADGTLDPAKWRTWMDRHRETLGELPGLRDRMRSVGEAAATVDRVAGLRKASMADIEKGVARYFLGSDPERAVQQALGSRDVAEGIRDLRRMLHENPAGLTALRRAYLDEWMRRAETTTLDAQGGYRLSPAAATRFARDSGGAAREIFTKADIERIEALVKDFGNGAFPASAGRAAGSNTYQNLSTGNFIAQVSNGAIDPSNAIAQALGSGFGLLQKFVYAHPEGLMRDLLREAMLEPKLARDLLGKVSRQNVERAIGYVERTMGQRIRDAALGAGARQGIRMLGTAPATFETGQRNQLLNEAALSAGARSPVNPLMSSGAAR